jgi:hypothetical protein
VLWTVGLVAWLAGAWLSLSARIVIWELLDELKDLAAALAVPPLMLLVATLRAVNWLLGLR